MNSKWNIQRERKKLTRRLGTAKGGSGTPTKAEEKMEVTGGHRRLWWRCNRPLVVHNRLWWRGSSVMISSRVDLRVEGEIYGKNYWDGGTQIKDPLWLVKLKVLEGKMMMCKCDENRIRRLKDDNKNTLAMVEQCLCPMHESLLFPCMLRKRAWIMNTGVPC